MNGFGIIYVAMSHLSPVEEREGEEVEEFYRSRWRESLLRSRRQWIPSLDSNQQSTFGLQTSLSANYCGHFFTCRDLPVASVHIHARYALQLL